MGREIRDITIADRNRLLIGIDPGGSTGICVLDLETRQIKSVYTLNFWETYALMSRCADPLVHISQVYIEQPSLVKSLYARHAARLKEAGSKETTRDKIVWDSGGNAREGILLRDGLRNLGYTVFDSKPVGRKKWTSDQFQQITGYPDRSNQHVRDAAFLVYGKSWVAQGSII
jgi:hypothetical protein